MCIYIYIHIFIYTHTVNNNIYLKIYLCNNRFYIFRSRFIILSRRSISLSSNISVLRCNLIISLQMSILCCSLSIPILLKLFSFILNNVFPVMSCLKDREDFNFMLNIYIFINKKNFKVNVKKTPLYLQF